MLTTEDRHVTALAPLKEEEQQQDQNYTVGKK